MVGGVDGHASEWVSHIFFVPVGIACGTLLVCVFVDMTRYLELQSVVCLTNECIVVFGGFLISRKKMTTSVPLGYPRLDDGNPRWIVSLRQSL